MKNGSSGGTHDETRQYNPELASHPVGAHPPPQEKVARRTISPWHRGKEMIIANLSRKQKRAAQDIGNKVLTVLLTISMVLQSSPVSYEYALEESVEPEVQVVEPAPEEEEAVVEAAPEQEAAPAAEEPAPAPEPEAASAPEPEPAPAQESAPAPAEPETTPEPAATPEPSAPAKAADTKNSYTFENDNL